MEILIRDYLDISTERGTIGMTYELFAQRKNDGFIHYGINTRNNTSGEEARVSDITVNKSDGVGLYQKILVGTVTPVTVRSIVEDYLAQ